VKPPKTPKPKLKSKSESKKLRIVTVKIPVGMLEKIDKMYKKLGYATRSELIREAIRYYLGEVESEEKVIENIDEIFG